MSTKIIYAAVATLAIISNTAQAAGFNHIPTFTPLRPAIAAARPVVNSASMSGLTRMETIKHVGKFTGNASSSHAFGGSGQAHNATNSQNSTNSTNSTQAHQAHQGSNCTARLHHMGFC